MGIFPGESPTKRSFRGNFQGETSDGEEIFLSGNFPREGFFGGVGNFLGGELSVGCDFPRAMVYI